MKSDINDLCEAFLAALTNAGYAVKSIENYKQVSNRFKKFCAENGFVMVTKEKNLPKSIQHIHHIWFLCFCYIGDDE